MTEESQPSFITDELDTRIIENIVEGKHSYGHIGPYEIKGLLGHGATSIVYKALGKDGKEYALKVFSYEKQQSRRELSRFYREIESLHRFRHHPNIITIHDAGHEENQFFITMDLLPGRTLNHVIEEEAPIRPERALRIILQIAGAIECMHEGGYVHRDIKPSNIMLLPGDFPVLMDFGLVQIRNSDLTLPGSILGTPGYMAPEQFIHGSRELHFTADIFSLGVLLYKMITGRFPFPIEENMAIGRLFQVLKENTPTPVNAHGIEISPELEKIIMKMIMFHPEDRYQTIEEFRNDVEAMQRGLQIRHVSPSLWTRLSRMVQWHPYLSIIVLSIIVLASAMGIHAIQRYRQLRQRIHQVFQTTLNQQIPGINQPWGPRNLTPLQWEQFHQLQRSGQLRAAQKYLQKARIWSRNHGLDHITLLWNIQEGRLKLAQNRFEEARALLSAAAGNSALSPDVRMLCHFEAGVALWLRDRKITSALLRHWHQTETTFNALANRELSSYLMGIIQVLEGRKKELVTPHPVKYYPSAFQALAFWALAQKETDPTRRRELLETARILGKDTFFWIK